MITPRSVKIWWRLSFGTDQRCPHPADALDLLDKAAASDLGRAAVVTLRGKLGGMLIRYVERIPQEIDVGSLQGLESLLGVLAVRSPTLREGKTDRGQVRILESQKSGIPPVI